MVLATTTTMRLSSSSSHRVFFCACILLSICLHCGDSFVIPGPVPPRRAIDGRSNYQQQQQYGVDVGAHHQGRNSKSIVVATAAHQMKPSLVTTRMNRSSGHDRGRSRNNNNQGDFQCVGDSSQVNAAAVYGLLRERGEARRNGYYKVADRILKELFDDHGVSVDDREKTWQVGSSSSGGGDPSAARSSSSRQQQQGAYIQSEYSDVPPTKDLKQIQGLISERVRAKKSRDFDTADRIREQLRDNWNVYIEDRLRQWAVGGNFGPEHAAFAGPTGESSKSEDYVRSIHSLAADDNAYILSQIEKRTQAKKDRDYATSDAIRDALLADCNVHMNDRLRQWSVGGDFGEFGKDRNRDFRRRGGGGGTLSNEQVADIASMLKSRIEAKKKRYFDKADSIRDELRSTYSVQIDDKTFEWWVMSNEYSPAAAGLLDEETTAYVQQQLAERLRAKENSDYGVADDIRDDLRELYGVEVDDRTREYTVETSDQYYDNRDFGKKEARGSTAAAPVVQMIDNNNEPVLGLEQLEQDEESHGTASQVDLSTLTVVQLKERLKDAGLKVSGKKAELIERLTTAAGSN